MEYGKLKVTVDYGDGFMSEATYHAYHFADGGVDVSVLSDLNSVDHSAQVHYDVDVMKNPQGIFGTATNVKYEWVEAPKLTGTIPHGSNLDDYKTPGVYCRELPGSASNVVTNVPDAVHNSTFVLEVLPAGAEGHIVQRITQCNKVSQIVCQRCFYADAWGDWYTVSMNDQRILWEGAYYMTAGHDIKLSDKISNMEKGITLVFSSYDATNKKPHDANFHFFDIPKRFVNDHAGRGVSILLANTGFTAIGHKYLYIHDDHITGHANNGETGTGSGVTYNNKYYVLRYVLGQ